MTRYIGAVLLIIFIDIGQCEKLEETTPTTIEYIQNYNIKTLKNSLRLGWKQFCEADVDEGVIAFFPGNSPSDATIHLVTPNNETISLPIKYLSKIAEFGLDTQLKTVVYVNTFLTNQIYDIRGNLQHMQKTRKDYNIIVVDFAQSFIQLYNTVKHNVFVEGYFISKLLSTLIVRGVKESDIILVGHSVGANIAALGATLHSQEEGSQKLSTLIAIDPALMCSQDDVYVNANVCESVVVIHGENDVFSMPQPLGTIDIYLNGNELKYQPGCNTKICSHVFPLLLFVDAVIERSSIMAVKCDSWVGFRRGKCDYSSVVSLGLDFKNATSGKYYCLTLANQPYMLEDNIKKYKKRSSRKSIY